MAFVSLRRSMDPAVYAGTFGIEPAAPYEETEADRLRKARYAREGRSAPVLPVAEPAPRNQTFISDRALVSPSRASRPLMETIYIPPAMTDVPMDPSVPDAANIRSIRQGQTPVLTPQFAPGLDTNATARGQFSVRPMVPTPAPQFGRNTQGLGGTIPTEQFTPPTAPRRSLAESMDAARASIDNSRAVRSRGSLQDAVTETRERGFETFNERMVGENGGYAFGSLPRGTRRMTPAKSEAPVVAPVDPSPVAQSPDLISLRPPRMLAARDVIEMEAKSGGISAMDSLKYRFAKDSRDASARAFVQSFEGRAAQKAAAFNARAQAQYQTKLEEAKLNAPLLNRRMTEAGAMERAKEATARTGLATESAERIAQGQRESEAAGRETEQGIAAQKSTTDLVKQGMISEQKASEMSAAEKVTYEQKVKRLDSMYTKDVDGNPVVRPGMEKSFELLNKQLDEMDGIAGNNTGVTSAPVKDSEIPEGTPGRDKQGNPLVRRGGKWVPR